MRTVAAAGCSSGAAAVSAIPGSFAESWKQIEPATAPAAASH